MKEYGDRRGRRKREEEEERERPLLRLSLYLRSLGAFDWLCDSNG